MPESTIPPILSGQLQQYLAWLRSEPQFQDLLAQIRPLLGRPLPRFRPREQQSEEQNSNWHYQSGIQDGMELVLNALLETDWTALSNQLKRKP